jgi:hypothetical protein
MEELLTLGVSRPQSHREPSGNAKRRNPPYCKGCGLDAPKHDDDCRLAPPKIRIRCDQCEMLCINGVNCHELGCPNAKKTWVPERGWVRYVECFTCGCEVEQGEACGCEEECFA